MKIIFQIDPQYDYEMALHMLRGKDWQHRARHMGLNPELVSRINQSTGEEQKKAEQELKEITLNTYTVLKEYIAKAKSAYQASWNSIVTEFSSDVAQLSVPWFYDDYFVNVTHFNPGISNWNGNVVARWWQENPDTQRRITAHEILLAHYFSVHQNLYKESGLIDRQIWALAEIFSFAMTGLEPRLKKFWPWDTRGYYTDHNYPHIVALQKDLEVPFLQRTSFDAYVLRGIEEVKKYPEIK